MRGGGRRGNGCIFWFGCGPAVWEGPSVAQDRVEVRRFARAADYAYDRPRKRKDVDREKRHDEQLGHVEAFSKSRSHQPSHQNAKVDRAGKQAEDCYGVEVAQPGDTQAGEHHEHRHEGKGQVGDACEDRPVLACHKGQQQEARDDAEEYDYVGALKGERAM